MLPNRKKEPPLKESTDKKFACSFRPASSRPWKGYKAEYADYLHFSYRCELKASWELRQTFVLQIAASVERREAAEAVYFSSQKQSEVDSRVDCQSKLLRIAIKV